MHATAMLSEAGKYNVFWHHKKTLHCCLFKRDDRKTPATTLCSAHPTLMSRLFFLRSMRFVDRVGIEGGAGERVFARHIEGEYFRPIDDYRPRTESCTA